MLDVLALAAHPDDAEAGCGGLLAKLARRGYRTGICDLTRGELASNGSPEIRAREAEAASRVLGLVERFQLELPDGGLDARDPGQVELVVRLLRRERPRLLVAPHAASRHPDHGATTELARRAQFFCAVRRHQPDLQPIVRPALIWALDWGPMRASFVVDIGAELEIKLEALRCYRSQFERGAGSHPTVLNDPSWLRRIETTAHHHGELAGCAAGEPYEIDAPIVLDDPLVSLATPREVRP